MSDTHTRKRSCGGMDRYDSQSCHKCMPIWVCKCCKTCILSENAIRLHLISCPKKDLQPTPGPEPTVKLEAKMNQHLQYNSDKSDEEDEEQLNFTEADILKIIS